jgi:hypothetical protein
MGASKVEESVWHRFIGSTQQTRRLLGYTHPGLSYSRVELLRRAWFLHSGCVYLRYSGVCVCIGAKAIHSC